MFIRLKVGTDAGAVVDVSAAAANVLIANGKATDPRDELPAPDETPSPLTKHRIVDSMVRQEQAPKKKAKR